MNDLGGARLLITINKKGGVATLQCHRETLEKILDLKGRVFSPSTSVLARKFLQVFESVLVPTAEGLDDDYCSQRRDKRSICAPLLDER